MNKTLVSIAAAALSTAALFASTAAFAADAKVSFGDLNLASTAGQKTLARRIDIAAHTVCDAQNITGSRIDHAYDCRVQLRQEIAAQVRARNPNGALSRVAFGN